MIKALKVLEMRYYGTIYGSYFLGCSSIGKAKIEGIEEEVFTTWGREIKPNLIKEFESKTHSTYPQIVYYPTSKNGKSIKKYEMIIPVVVMNLMQPALGLMNKEDGTEKMIPIYYPEPKSKTKSKTRKVNNA